jgi:hypothetical protein
MQSVTFNVFKLVSFMQQFNAGGEAGRGVAKLTADDSDLFEVCKL